MSQEKTVDQAKSLIADRNFNKAYKVCEALLKNHTDETEAAVLAAACLLCQGCPKSEAKKRERVRKAVARALETAETPEAAANIELRLIRAVCRHRGEQMEAGLRKQKEKASLPELKKYFDLVLQYEEMPRLIREVCGEKYPEMAEKSTEKSTENPEEEWNRKLAQQEHEIARSVFGEARMLVDFHAAGTSKEVSETLRSAIEMLTVAQVLAHRSETACDAEELCRRKETEAEILRFGLTGMLHPDGNSLSLYCDGRADMLERLQQLYGEIAAQKPEFKAPELPSAEAINTVPQKNAKPGLFGKKK